jgi:hypothetical protein
MQSTTSRKTIEVKLKEKTENLSMKEYSRWLCLIEAIELVCTKAKQIKVDTANNIDWINLQYNVNDIDKKIISSNNIKFKKLKNDDQN